MAAIDRIMRAYASKYRMTDAQASVIRVEILKTIAEFGPADEQRANASEFKDRMTNNGLETKRVS